MTKPKLASMYPVPQKYYVPQRIRKSYHPRLSASGIGGLNEVEAKHDDPFAEEGIPSLRRGIKQDRKIKTAFELEKVTSSFSGLLI